MMQLCILAPDADYRKEATADLARYRTLFGMDVTMRPWFDPGDLRGFDLVLPLLAWGYHNKRDRWLALLDEWEQDKIAIANPVSLLRWNSDKAYLLDLEAAGISIVPTRISYTLSETDIVAARSVWPGDLVIKPSCSGGADGTYRLAPGETCPAHVLGREMLLQPVMSAILSEGEYSLLYFDGAFSHALIKRPQQGDFRVQSQFGGEEIALTPPAEAQALALDVLAALPTRPLYARVDLVRDPSGAFCLMELEIIEPSLFLHLADDGGQALIHAIEKQAAP